MAILKNDKVSGEVAAAIAMALYQLNEEVHDLEHGVLTFGNAGRLYSPWSSKIYGLRQAPQRR
jgi:hypothetical protein